MCSIECTRSLITDLKVLGKVGPKNKINTKTIGLDLDDTHWYQSIIRWYRGDSRYIAGNKIKSIVQHSSDIVNDAIKFDPDNKYYEDMTPKEFLEFLKDTLRDAKVGLEHLKDTYFEDNRFSSELESYINSLNRQVKIINNF